MGGACYPEGYDPEGGGAPLCRARSPGPLGLRDAADPDATAVMGRTPGTMGVNDAAACMANAATSNMPEIFGPIVAHGQEVDQAFLIIEAEVRDASAPTDSWMETTAENLLRFGYENRTDWPGWLMDAKTIAERFREFGGATFYSMKGKGPGKEGKRYLVFRGNPRRPGKFFGIRDMIRGNGLYSFENPKIIQLGIGAKAALKAGAQGTFISFVVVGAIDIVAELIKDEPSMRRLGVQIALDAVNVVLSGLAGFAGAMAVVKGAAALGAVGVLAVGAAPVWAVAVGALVVGLAVSYGLGKLDERYGLSETIHKKAEEMQNEWDWGVQRFFSQLDWCMRNPYHCFGR